MEELSIEEKARLYEEALERARKINSGKDIVVPSNWTTCEFIFPELRESKNEKMRKAIIKSLPNGGYLPQTNIKVKDAIAWLERQGDIDIFIEEIKRRKEIFSRERKKGPNTKSPSRFVLGGRIVMLEELLVFVKEMQKLQEEAINKDNTPKFKVGDWVVINKYPLLIRNICNNTYKTMLGSEHGTYDIDVLDRKAHLWTINDAKVGDILVASDESIFIYAGSTSKYAKMYVVLTKDNEIDIEGGDWEDKNAVQPATKGQQDLLFQKMAEKGYRWNSENRDVNLLPQKKTSSLKRKEHNHV